MHIKLRPNTRLFVDRKAATTARSDLDTLMIGLAISESIALVPAGDTDVRLYTQSINQYIAKVNSVLVIDVKQASDVAYNFIRYRKRLASDKPAGVATTSATPLANIIGLTQYFSDDQLALLASSEAASVLISYRGLINDLS